jgi:quercetin dioxygenase-like cupin family protein
MPKFTSVDEREWLNENLVGHAIDRCKLWYDGEGVSFSLVKMAANYELSLHRHETWVAVFVVKGTMKWEGDGEERKLGEGDFYFVRPGEVHVETSIDEAMVLIVKAEPNVQYQVDPVGERR